MSKDKKARRFSSVADMNHNSEKSLNRRHFSSSSASSSSSSAHPSVSRQYVRPTSLVILAVVVWFVSTSFFWRRFRGMYSKPYIEQKLSMFSESAFYYAFYNDIVEAPSMQEGIRRILHDNRSEHPDVLISLRRFNVYQEVLLGIVYRLLAPSLMPFRTAWNFYAFCVFNCLGAGIAALGVASAYLGGNVGCGLATVGFFWGNFVLRLILRSSSVPLRENWGTPFLWMNILILIILLRKSHQQPRASLKLLWVSLGCVTLALMLVWQFSVFILTTQTTALFGTILLGYSSVKATVRQIFLLYGFIFCIAYFIQFMPHYLLFSFFPHTLIAVLCVLYGEYLLGHRRRTLGEEEVTEKGNSSALSNNLYNKFLWNCFLGFCALAVCAVVRVLVSQFEKDDSHVFQLLLTKLGLGEHTFDTKIYLMGGTEFNFFPKFMFDLTMPSKVVIFASIMAIVYIFLCFTDLLRCITEDPPFPLKSSGKIEEMGKTQQNEEELMEKSVNLSSSSSSFSSRDQLRRRYAGGEDGESNTNSSGQSGGKNSSRSGNNSWIDDEEKEELQMTSLDKTGTDSQHPEMCFVLLQTLAFVILMLLIARLRVLALPMLCLLGGTFGSPYILSVGIIDFFAYLTKFFRFLCNKIKESSQDFVSPTNATSKEGTRKSTYGITTAYSHKFVHGSVIRYILANIWIIAFSVLPYFLSMPWEQMKVSPIPEDAASKTKLYLIEWMNTNLPENAALLSDMPMSAAIRVGTRFHTIIHPQYEDVKLRQRVQFVYATSACPPLDIFSDILHSNFSAEYLLLSVYRCAAPKGDSSVTNVWHVASMIDEKRFLCKPEVEYNQRFCWRIQLEQTHFKMLYRNGDYCLMQRLPTPTSHSVEYSEFPWKSKIIDINSWRPWIENCLKTDKHCGVNMAEFARQLLDMYNLPQASKMLYDEVIRLFPNDPEVLYHYAEYLDFDLKQPEKAEKFYQLGVDLDPYNPTKLIDYALYVDQFKGRKDHYQQAAKLMMDIDKALTNNVMKLEWDDAKSLCRASTLLNQYARDDSIGSRAMKLEWANAAKHMWKRAKKLNVQNSCIVNEWDLLEGTGKNKTKWDILGHFMFWP